jgi:subtilase family serine protease
MRRGVFAALSAVTVLCLTTIAPAATAGAAPAPATGYRDVHVCAATPVGSAGCSAIRRDPVAAGATAQPRATRPVGYVPEDLRMAYDLESATGDGATVAIVDAYDDPTAEADLGVYRSEFGLPPCTTENGCFRKVSQTGSPTDLPIPDGGWAQEISLDVDMVSAICPDCHILLVEGRSARFDDLATAVRYAASQPGVVAISNSYGAPDFSDPLAAAYNQPGIAVTAATGDSGYGVSAPASFPTVIAVGGTALQIGAAGVTESAWSGAGSGCSTLHANPGYQIGTGCPGKAEADVSAVADPVTGVAVYDNFAFQGEAGWLRFGGTSVATPIIAAVYAMGTAVRAGGYPGAFTWAHAGDATALNDVTGGVNGVCPVILWCEAGRGWDGPTGLGSPRGTGAF